MSVTTWSCSVLSAEISAESVPWESSGEVFFALAKPQSILRQTISATEKTRQFVSLGYSLLAHAVVIAAISVAPTGSAVRWVPVQVGPATVELQASLGDVAEEQAEGEPAALVEDVAFLEELEPVAEASLSATAAASLDRPVVEARVPEVLLASLATTETVAPVVQAKLDRPQRDEPVAVAASQPAETRSHLTRTNIGRQHATELVAEAIPAPASVASQASDGAESSVPTPVHNPAPPYPPEALAARTTGRVILRVEVAADGCVLRASVYRSSGVSSLDASALATVRQWRFTPASRPDAPSREVAVPINFVLADS